MRLYVRDRSRILDKVMAHTFEKQETVLFKEEREISEEIYNYFFSKRDIELMASLQEGWLPKVSNFYVNVGGWNIPLELSEEKSIPYSKHRVIYYSGGPIGSVTDHNIVQKAQTISQKKEKLRETKNTFRRKFDSFLRSITTVKRLKEEMPEIEEIIGKDFFTEPPKGELVPFVAELVAEMKKHTDV